MHSQPLAYLDPLFLESEEARPLRILAEYLEPLDRFKAQNIQDTVVFSGRRAFTAAKQPSRRSSSCRNAPVDARHRARGAPGPQPKRSSGRATTKGTRTGWPADDMVPFARVAPPLRGDVRRWPGIMEAANRAPMKPAARPSA